MSSTIVRASLVVTLVLAVVVRAGAQAPAGDAEARGRKVVEQAVVAMGGAEALAAVKDFSTTGTITIATPMGEMTADTLAEVVFPDRSRQTLELPMGRMVQGFDGKVGWMTMGGQSMDVPAEMLTEMRRGLVTAGGIELLRLAHAGKAQVQALDPADVNGRKADAVLWKLGDMEMRVFFDAETHDIAKLAYRAVTPGAPTPMDVEVVISDVRAVGGLRFPFRAVGTQNGQKYLEFTAKEIKVNSGIPATGFEKPAQ